MDDRKPADQTPNPYAPSTLYEPAAERERAFLQAPIEARGKIAWEDRRQGLLLSGWATFEDWGDFLIYNGIGLIITGVIAVLVSVVPALLFLAVFSIRALLKYVRSQWLMSSALRAQDLHGDRLVERQITSDGILANVNGRQVLLPWEAYHEGRIDEERIILLTQNRETFQIFPRGHFKNRMDWELFQRAVKKCVKRVR